MYTNMENWAEIRRRVKVDGLSKRAACREYAIHWDTPPPPPRRTLARVRCVVASDPQRTN